jgi:hypothetical protein
MPNSHLRAFGGASNPLSNWALTPGRSDLSDLLFVEAGALWKETGHRRIIRSFPPVVDFQEFRVRWPAILKGVHCREIWLAILSFAKCYTESVKPGCSQNQIVADAFIGWGLTVRGSLREYWKDTEKESPRCQ